jgi:hypothetical protein
MELEYFTKLERVQHNDITIFMITVLRELPTPLQWQFTMESFREEFDRVKHEHNKFAFIMDVRKIGRISIAQIKEFVNLLESFTVVLQEYLVASSILTTKNSILAVLFEIMKTFYKTKKPLLFVYDIKSAYDHIDSFDMNIVKDD